MHFVSRRVIAGLAVVLGSAVIASAASAAITPTVTLDQTAGTAAESITNLGLDIKFAPDGTDSPKDLTLTLPAGLLANASINNGACLTTTTPIAACQVGSGTVAVTTEGILQVSGQLAFYLVAPPKPRDLAGVALELTLLGQTSELGTPADISVRPSTDPAGVGLNMVFTNIPETFGGASIAVDEIQSTFSGLRMPASCPATPANFGATADSYSDPTEKTASAPLAVTSCSALPYSPKLAVTVARDSADPEVRITADVTQTAAEATSKSVLLAFPSSALAPNLGVVSELCSNPASGTCTTVGSATATSPLYPTALVGQAYLTGSLTAPALTLVFGPPFSLTLNGAVSLANNSTTFQNVPDIPLTALDVTLDGGSHAVFQSTCAAPTGTATATLTTQNGDRAAFASSTFTVSGCPPPTKATTTPPKPKVGRPSVGSGSLSGLAAGKPSLGFTLVAGQNAPKLRSFTIALPGGLRFVKRRVHKRLVLEGVSVKGAKVKSLSLKAGGLVVTLRQPAASITVKLGAQALSESGRLRKQAERNRVKHLRLAVSATDAHSQTTDLTPQI